jgi:hypothetical protein
LTVPETSAKYATLLEDTMVSDTCKTERRRRHKRATVGRDQKRTRAKAGTPKFPIHAEEKKA